MRHVLRTYMPRVSGRATVGIVAAVLLIAALMGWRHHRADIRLRAVAENTAKGEELKEALDRRFPIGASEAEVLDFLQRAHPDFRTFPSTARTEYWVPVGIEPSNVWYCRSTTAYVVLRFEARQLVRSEIGRWSADCL